MVSLMRHAGNRGIPSCAVHCKRILDLVGAGAGLVLLAPLFGFLSLAIWAASGHPIYFRQMRAGVGGRPFVLYKFRTMRPLKDAEKGAFDAGSSSRVTPVGRFLRKTKLDELPQLWNVVKGDMSLVGPRPEVQRWVTAYPERWAVVHQVRPGITDPASIEFRDEEELLAAAEDPEKLYRETILPRKLDLYEEYVRTRTFWGDVKILWRTVVAVLRPGRAGSRRSHTKQEPTAKHTDRATTVKTASPNHKM